MPEYVSQRIAVALNRYAKAVKGSRILMLGLAYKRNSGDVRVSPVPVLCDRLAALGADVHAVDPHVAPEQFPSSAVRVMLTEEELKTADLVVVAADHDVFNWELVVGSARQILDTRHRVPMGDHVEYL